MLKYAEFQMLAAELAPGATRGLRRAVAHRGSTDIVFDKTAHRADFSHIEKRPGYLYVRSRAISSRCNDNFDEFPAGEIKLGYKTFIGKPAFVNHHNDNHKRARGVIVAAELHEDINPDGSPDTWVEVLHEVDAVKFPKLAAGILAGEIDRTSMGTDCAWSLCSVCGNKAENPSQYCQHIPRLKGKKFIRRNAATGKQEEVLCREICGGLSFFENSFLVEPPADPTAHVLGVESGPGVAKAASLVHEAASDGLATRYRCRSGQGIMCDRGDGKPTRKKCSYCGSPFMVERGLHGVFHHNPKSVYREHEALSTHTNRAKAQAAADKVDDGVVRWIYKDNPSTTGSLHTAGTISCPECGLYEFDENDELLPRTPGPGCWYCHERGVVDTDQKLPNIWENHTVQDLLDSKTSSLQKTSSLDEEFAALMKLATQPSSVSDHVAEPEWETSTAADLCKTCGWPVERGPNGWTHEEKNPVQWSDRRKQGSLSTLSYGEVMAPPKVDTLRDPECPICQSDSYDGQRCPTCLFVKPPDDFMDPNLEMARQVDLRQEQQGQAINDLSCDSCGNEF
jgi:hypothetical protein